MITNRSNSIQQGRIFIRHDISAPSTIPMCGRMDTELENTSQGDRDVLSLGRRSLLMRSMLRKLDLAQ